MAEDRVDILLVNMYITSFKHIYSHKHLVLLHKCSPHPSKMLFLFACNLTRLAHLLLSLSTAAKD